MLKRKDSRYESGRVKGGWYKWKIDPYFAEMVLVSAQLGHGKGRIYTAITRLRYGTSRENWSRWPRRIRG